MKPIKSVNYKFDELNIYDSITINTRINNNLFYFYYRLINKKKTKII